MEKIIKELEIEDFREYVTQEYAKGNYDWEYVQKIYNEFNDLYGKTALENLSGKDLLLRLFGPKMLCNNGLIYSLEFKKEYKMFGGIGGGSSYKYGLFFSEDKNSWIKGNCPKNAQLVSEEEAIAYAEETKKVFLKLHDIVLGIGKFEKPSDYKKLENLLIESNQDFYYRIWITKYLHMIYYNSFSCFYSYNWRKLALKFTSNAKINGLYYDNGLISLYANDLNIPNCFFADIIHKIVEKSKEDEDEYKYDFSENEKIYTLNEDSYFEYNVLLPHRNLRTNKMYPLNMIIYGAPGTGKTYSTINYSMAIIENCAISNLETCDRKTLMNKYKKMVEDGRIVFTTFHQSYGYEDFIQGLRPDSDAGALIVKPCDGVFKKIADKAMYDFKNDYVIIIDEINRANISKVFGELITLLEEDKRWGELNELSVKLPSKDTFAIPNNLYIIGTMNTADKSISLIDIALRRRFEFIEQTVNYDVIKNEICRNFLESLNKKIIEELESTDLLIGHAYFINKSEDDLLKVINQNIIPLLYEYFFDNTKKVRHVLDKALEGTKLKLIDNEFSRVKVDKK